MPTFYDQVYAVVRRVPRGRVTSYGRVARMLGRPKAARAVGYALSALAQKREPAPSVPWQRVINARGEVSHRHEPGRDGFQRHLLEEEGVGFGPLGRVDLGRFGWDPGRAR